EPVPRFDLVENPDILATISALPKQKRPQLVIGFAAETENIIQHATAKLARKQCDWMIANDVSGDVMGGEHNQVSILRGQQVENWPDMSKQQTAKRLADAIADTLLEDK
ncbi:Phosphopantothenoylcysteine decarboxylase / Phosphopantothenoylcysteine synthetase, partial [hydrothermal vent metagenome]